MKKYIAYGSNLSVSQMGVRCPDARVVGKAIIHDWKLVFREHATIEPEKGKMVPVLIWELSERDEKNLDIYEGYPFYYTKVNKIVTMTDLDGNNPRRAKAMVYLMNKGHKLHVPTIGYYKTLREGYERFGFDCEILSEALDRC